MLHGELLDYMWAQWKDDKEAITNANGGPTPIGMRFMLDFGTSYKSWPFFTVERARAAGFMPVDGLDSDESLLAVYDSDNNRAEIMMAMARLLTLFGPPEMAGAMTDAYTLRIPPEEREEYLTKLATEQKLEDDYNTNPDTRVVESLTMSVFNHDGEHQFRSVLFHYDDTGSIVYHDEEIDQGTEPMFGTISSLLQALVHMHGLEPHDVLIELCQGDETQVAMLLAQSSNDLN